jgi:hypothetical protein
MEGLGQGLHTPRRSRLHGGAHHNRVTECACDVLRASERDDMVRMGTVPPVNGCSLPHHRIIACHYIHTTKTHRLVCEGRKPVRNAREFGPDDDGPR